METLSKTKASAERRGAARGHINIIFMLTQPAVTALKSGEGPQGGNRRGLSIKTTEFRGSDARSQEKGRTRKGGDGWHPIRQRRIKSEVSLSYQH